MNLKKSTEQLGPKRVKGGEKGGKGEETNRGGTDTELYYVVS